MRMEWDDGIELIDVVGFRASASSNEAIYPALPLGGDNLNKGCYDDGMVDPLSTADYVRVELAPRPEPQMSLYRLQLPPIG